MKRTQFNHTITSHLFKRKLAQNMITIESLIHETIEQEMRELIIGLALLHKNDDDAMTSETLKLRAESFLDKYFGINTVQFDIYDCINKLADLNLLEDEFSSSKKLKVVSLETARDRIKSRTRAEFTMV
jgi:hypothetical protein